MTLSWPLGRKIGAMLSHKPQGFVSINFEETHLVHNISFWLDITTDEGLQST
jgi:hypothetical protein